METFQVRTDFPLEAQPFSSWTLFPIQWCQNPTKEGINQTSHIVEHTLLHFITSLDKDFEMLLVEFRILNHKFDQVTFLDFQMK